MKVQINDQYHVAIDNYNHTLVETYFGTKQDSGETTERTRPLGYFGSIEQALVFLARYMVVKGHEELSLNEYLTELRNAHTELVKAVKGVQG